MDYKVIGVMSGSSLDGLDLAYVSLKYLDNKWHYELLHSTTVALDSWETVLAKDFRDIASNEVEQLDEAFGRFIGNQIKEFIPSKQLPVDLIASHGHTLFHYPEKGITCQIGNGQTIANSTGIKVVSNLRKEDIDAGGSGAPIVPIGDLHLFKEFDYCLNVGGIANITRKTPNEVIAFDVCPANQVLNHYANKLGFAYDDSGGIAAKGEVNKTLLNRLSEMHYFNIPAPKSLDNSFTKEVIQVIDKLEENSTNVLASYSEFIAQMVAKSIDDASPKKSILVTGGGAFNDTLMQHLRRVCACRVSIPSNAIVNYKEALVMGLIGVLKVRNEVNCLASVTGAKTDTICGTIFYPNFVQI